MKNRKKDKVLAVLGTLLIHALVVLVLALMAFRPSDPPEGGEDEGVEVNLGMYDEGMGDNQTDKSAIPESEAPPKPHENESVISDEDIVTQDTEETFAINTEKKKDSKEKTEIEPKEEPKKEPEKPQVNEKALFKKTDKPQEGSSEGITGKPGDQGKPNGTPGATNYDEQGGKGNGPGISFDLGNRGSKSLQPPSKNFTEEGQITVKIRVNREGKVVKAEISDKGTFVSNKEMRQMALEAARNSEFVPDPNAPEEQIGTITYNFLLNH
ncbi:MAG: TonB family protein [Bacteroidales bacterium]|nr:TonB family protein [Bacteroidales bacterium]